MRSLYQATTDTVNWFGLNPRTGVVMTVTLALGFCLLWRVRGLSEARVEIMKTAIVIGIPFALLVTGLFLFYVIQAPSRR